MPDYMDVLNVDIRVNIYSGPNHDEHKKYWNARAVGDMQDENFSEPELTINLVDYPPGTKVIVREPLCPLCYDSYQNCMIRTGPGACTFDWKAWTEEQYQ